MADITESMFEAGPEPKTPSKSNLQSFFEPQDKEIPPPKRNLPWLIDIFLYPVSKAGLATLAVLIGLPIFVELLKYFMSKVAIVFPPMVVFFYFVYVAGFFVDIVALLYIYWYICQCIKKSAEGEIRAPDTIGETPGIGEMLIQLMKIIFCLSVFTLPATLYYVYTKSDDATLAILVCVSMFLYPMALLSVIMFDSLSGLNPIIVIGSIFGTFFQYCALVICMAVFGYAIVKVYFCLAGSIILLWVMIIAQIYLLMIAAHLLGRFYFKNQKKLNWDF